MYGSLYPWHFTAYDHPAGPLATLIDSAHIDWDRFGIRDIIVNIALYVPAGFFGFFSFRRERTLPARMAIPVLTGALLSLCIELTQLFDLTRRCSAVDVATNTLGSGAGVMVALAAQELGLKLSINTKKRTGDRRALLLLAAWVGSLVFPVFPDMSRGSIWTKMLASVGDGAFAFLPFLTAVMVWYLAGRAVWAAALKPSKKLIAATALLVPAQFFLQGRQPIVAVFAGALVGALLYTLLWKHRNSWQIPLACAFLLLLVIRGLWPFEIGPAIPMSWIPFGGFLAMDWQTGMQLVLEKVFYYGIPVWLLRTAGVRASLAIPAVAGVLLGIEIGQIYLPGHSAEITDPLIAIGIGMAMETLKPGSS